MFQTLQALGKSLRLLRFASNYVAKKALRLLTLLLLVPKHDITGVHHHAC